LSFKCLYIEDDNNIRDIFVDFFNSVCLNLVVAKDGKEALEIFKKEKFDLIISDINMPNMNGIEFAKEVRKTDKNVKIIFITGYDIKKYLQQAIDLDVEAYLIKPINLNELLNRVQKIYEEKRKQEEKEKLHKLLNLFFDNTNDAYVIFENNNIIHSNEKFNNLKIDQKKIFNLNHQDIINIGKFIYKINKKTIDNYTMIKLYNITSLHNEIYIDNLTQLYNRKIIEKILNKIDTIGVILIDLDNFKKINDTYGHNVGDFVLQKTAEIIKKSVRRNDYEIRWGGEEFLIILNNIDKENLFNIAKKIRQKIENYNFEVVGKVTASFGICIGEVEDKESFLKLIEKVDKALYTSKREGKNRITSCDMI